MSTRYHQDARKTSRFLGTLHEGIIWCPDGFSYAVSRDERDREIRLEHITPSGACSKDSAQQTGGGGGGGSRRKIGNRVVVEKKKLKSKHE